MSIFCIRWEKWSIALHKHYFWNLFLNKTPKHPVKFNYCKFQVWTKKGKNSNTAHHTYYTVYIYIYIDTRNLIRLLNSYLIIKSGFLVQNLFLCVCQQFMTTIYIFLCSLYNEKNSINFVLHNSGINWAQNRITRNTNKNTILFYLFYLFI